MDSTRGSITLNGRETFALYGFRIEIPLDWQVEVNPKATRENGDVAFHSPKGNGFFVSWGQLDKATKRFRSLQDHRDKNVKQIRSGSDVMDLTIDRSYEDTLLGHVALFSHVSAEVKGGMFSRTTSERNMWWAHFYCQNSSRYYVIYSVLRDSQEYPDPQKMFENTVKSFVCH